ncbi:hypothetical protein RMSM_00191 [Rhodopirellula maiorica SM1]|uniref:Uncharacterized protein n=1 Tax=Rhodopirellula maiorica SM1 TaxID=1265738 RepID=M5RUK6_9BACT|nr:hypothetical protein RMSM_00191 [Rhodopirellula maiorica SM1]
MRDAMTVIIFVVSSRASCVKIAENYDVLTKFDPHGELSENVQNPCHPGTADDALLVWALGF